MIGRLRGRVLTASPGRVLLDVAGVGYEIQIPLSTFYALPSASETPVSLHVHTHVREDALQLYGFATEEERTVFEQLISISGVGPRLALAILSGIGVDELRRAVRDEDRPRLCKIPGVGRKTAERVLLELRDKLDRILDRARESGATSAAGAPYEDAVSALVNLGYTPDVARRAVDRALAGSGAPADLQGLLKTALGKVFKPGPPSTNGIFNLGNHEDGTFTQQATHLAIVILLA